MNELELSAAILAPLCTWYRSNQRILPWRADHDPYRVWVSEIMLQQTRVEAALPYYERFLKALPTVEALAAAPEEKLLKLWEGLGYYSRVRNMQKAAIIIAEQYDGHFPADAGLLLKLPGIGDYTAGAIASIAFGLPAPAVDGNVLRVMARLWNDDADIMQPQTKQRVKAALSAVYPMADNCSDLTQALMELGALICIPGTPRCAVCPLQSLCRAYHAGTADRLPVRNIKNEKKLIKRTILLFVANGSLALVRRPSKGVLANMWEFPSLDGHVSQKEAIAALQALNITEAPRPFINSRHVFTHLIWDMKSYFIPLAAPSDRFQWATIAELTHELTLPSAMQPFYRALLKEGCLKPDKGVQN